MKKMLKVGDVIILEKGMTVYGQIPDKFVYANAKLSESMTHSEVVVGRIYNNKTKITDTEIKEIASEIVRGFDRVLGFKLKFNDAKEFVKSKISEPNEDTFILEDGEFVVIKTAFDGGGHGMGHNDYYPDGHHVFCKRLKNGKYDEKGHEVEFYQSGSFTAVIEPEKLSVVRTLTPKFV